jgi:hypothetical protein
MRPFFVLILLLLASPARAEDEVSTSTHFGYGLVARSSDGFKNVGGTLAFFDVSTPLSDGLDAGLRSLAQGGRTLATQYYRLGSGPFLSWEALQDLFLQVTVNAFRESVLDAQGDRLAARFGRTLMVGTQRFLYRSARVDAGFGGFSSWHAAPGAFSLVHGVDLSVRLRL